MTWPLHTLVLAVGCSAFVLGLFDRKPWLLIMGVVFIAAGMIAVR